MPCLPESGDCGGRCCNEMSAVPPRRHVIICNSLSSRVASGAHCAALFFCKEHHLALAPEGHLHFRFANPADFVSVKEVPVARLRQYDSTLSLADYVVQDPTRFAQGTMRQAGVHASSVFFSGPCCPLLVLRLVLLRLLLFFG